MGSVKIVLRQKQDKSGNFPLAIRITKDRKATYIYLGQNIAEKDWDAQKEQVRKSHPNSVRLNNFLLKKKAEANNTLLELETEKEAISSKAVKQTIKPTVGLTFFLQAEAYLENLKLAGKYVQFQSQRSRYNAFKEFLNGNDLAFSDITQGLLNQYRAWLEGKRQLKERSVINHMLLIRDVFSRAIKDNQKIEKYYPFGQGKVSLKFPQSQKMGLSKEEVQRIENLELPEGSAADHARNVWLISFYFAGVRVSDVLKLKWTDFQDDRLHYTMGKNNKTGSLKVSEKALKVLEKYRQKRDQTNLIFPELRSIPNLDNEFEVQKKVAFANRSIMKQLKKIAELTGIDKKLSMHISRHTFGNLSGDTIPVQMLQKLYRHSSITTTIGYQANFINKEADEALEKVLGF